MIFVTITLLVAIAVGIPYAHHLVLLRWQRRASSYRIVTALLEEVESSDPIKRHVARDLCASLYVDHLRAQEKKLRRYREGA